MQKINLFIGNFLGSPFLTNKEYSPEQTELILKGRVDALMEKGLGLDEALCAIGNDSSLGFSLRKLASDTFTQAKW